MTVWIPLRYGGEWPAVIGVYATKTMAEAAETAEVAQHPYAARLTVRATMHPEPTT